MIITICQFMHGHLLSNLTLFLLVGGATSPMNEEWF